MAVYMKGTDSSGNDTVLAVETDGSLQTLTDANGVRALNLDLYTKEIQAGTGVTYTAYALPGTALATAGWMAFETNDTTGVRKFADGDTAFDNVATDLSALTYSY